MPKRATTTAQRARRPATKAASTGAVRPPDPMTPANTVVAKPSAKSASTPATGKPTRLSYALKAYTAERRVDGWWICRTPFTTVGEKPDWSGPFETIETAVLAIGRRLATEIADRHTRSIEGHKLASDDPLYGLKATTRLDPTTGASSL